MGEDEVIDLDVSFGSEVTVHIAISGHTDPLQVIKALEKLGSFEYLSSLYDLLTGEVEFDDDDWDDGE